jgi:hypothetical protein
VGFSRTKKQDPFWQIVGDMEWRLDDGRVGATPPDEPEFGHSGRRTFAWPRWTTHAVAFALGAVACATAFRSPSAFVVGLVGTAVGTLVTIAYRRR